MKSQYDAVIVGTGIAGLYTALNISGKKRVLLISKTQLSSGSTPLAQGGIVSCIYKKSHFEDTVKAGSFYNKREAVLAIENDSKENIEKLINLGVDFEKDKDGSLKYTREGGHSENTILYVKDRTGKEIAEKLIDAVREKRNIEVTEHTMAIEIVKTCNRVSGLMVINKAGEKHIVKTENLVLATGGIGELYLCTTNTRESTGDGIAIAYRAGASVKDMEFIQFHPTSFLLSKEKKRFLISESLRGEGAKLVDENGIRFMKKYHELGELAPRDVVSRGIYREIAEGRKVYLDIRHERKEHLQERFPTIYEKCLSEGVDISKELIEVSPAEHYIMGGIETDLYGSTDVDGLFACGECACTGVHGGNRLASNSLLEGLVFGNRIAKTISSSLSGIRRGQSIGRKSYKKTPGGKKSTEGSDHDFESTERIRDEIKTIMERHLGIVRTDRGIREASKMISRLEKDLSSCISESVGCYEAANMITVAKLIISAAGERADSLGAHYIEREESAC